MNYAVLGFALLFEGAAWWFALRGFNATRGKWDYFEAVHRGKDPSLFVVLFEDSAAMLGLLVAFVGILLSQLTGIPHFDGAASVVIGLILGGAAIWLAYETKGLLIGEAANVRVIASIRKVLGEHAGVAHTNEVLTMHMGPQFILANISVEFADGLTSNQIEAAIAELDAGIRKAEPNVRRIFVEAEARWGSATAVTKPVPGPGNAPLPAED